MFQISLISKHKFLFPEILRNGLEKYLLVNQIKNAKIHIQRVKKYTKDPVLKNKIIDLEKEILKRKSK